MMQELAVLAQSTAPASLHQETLPDLRTPFEAWWQSSAFGGCSSKKLNKTLDV